MASGDTKGGTWQMAHLRPFDSAGRNEQYAQSFKPLSKIAYMGLQTMEQGGSVHIGNRQLTTMAYPSRWSYVKSDRYDMWIEYYPGQEHVIRDKTHQQLLSPRSNVVARMTTRMRNANAVSFTITDARGQTQLSLARTKINLWA